MKTRFDFIAKRWALAGAVAALVLVSSDQASADRQFTPPGPAAIQSQSFSTQLRRWQDEANYYLDVAVTGIPPEQVRVDRRGRTLVVEVGGQRARRMISPDGSAESFVSQSQHMRQPVSLPSDSDLEHMQRQESPGMVRIVVPKLQSAPHSGTQVRPREQDLRL